MMVQSLCALAGKTDPPKDWQINRPKQKEKRIKYIRTRKKYKNNTVGQFSCSSDREPPSIMVCPTDFAIGQEPGEVFGIADWTIPTVTDNVNVTFFYQSFIPPGQMNLGSKAVSYLARDDAGNQAVCAFIVTVLGKLQK